MKPLVSTLGGVALLLMAAGAIGRVGQDFKPEEGFTSLFNGRDLTGWTYRGSKEKLDGKARTEDGRVRVEDGVIVMMPKDDKGKGGIKVLDTARKYPTPFHLRLEFRASLKSDSGVYVRGPQLQVRDFIRRNEQPQLKKTFKNDDWNTLDILVRNNVLFTTVNGKFLSPRDNLELSYRDGKASATLNGKVIDPVNVQVRRGSIAECKVNGEPLEVMTNIPASGPIGLQAEAGKFEFRHVRIKELE